jgi:Putative beta barrel porin-7 (BBP7)
MGNASDEAYRVCPLELGEIESMTNSTRMFGLIMTVALWIGVAAAQGPVLSGSGDDLPPDLELPSQGFGSSIPMSSMQPSGEAGEFSAESFGAPHGDGYDLSGESDCPDAAGMWNEAAPIESTGTWLQRGFWYAETDAVVLNRAWNSNDKRFAAQDPLVNTPPAPGVSLGFDPRFLNTNRVLIVSGALPGQDASVRGTLGHFLFRDSRNRDHTVEFTAFGGASWEQDRVLSSETPNGLFVPFIIDGGNPSFDQSTRQSIQYSSNLNSFELNYRVRGRLGHDQLVMDPNGNWHRAANTGFERDYLAGLRFLQLGERFDWNAQDIVAAGDDGSYLIRTTNDLFGLQFGLGVTYQTPRWSIGTKCKGGVYVNDAVGESHLNFTANDTNDANLRLRENQFSFAGDFGILGRYHVMPNVSLRAGYDLMLITSVALAPSQATFINDYSFLNTTGYSFYHGASAGVELYW